MKVPLSDHFDGNRFFNPTLPKGFAPSRLDAIKMAREPHSQWPTWVENTGVHRLNEMRAADEIAAITFVNHATFLIETGGITILTDPIYAWRPTPPIVARTLNRSKLMGGLTQTPKSGPCRLRGALVVLPGRLKAITL